MYICDSKFCRIQVLIQENIQSDAVRPPGIPLLSIIMPAFNAERYIREAIGSILGQDFREFELIIIDDGSADRTFEIAASFSDKRIILLQNDVNRGIVFSRNRGIGQARGSYIGMLDADDIAMPGKFRKQVEFLESNRDFGMVGSWAMLIDENGKCTGKAWKLPGKPDKIPPVMLFKNYFVQSAVVFRRSCLPEYRYKEGYEIVEDYKLWIDILKRSKGWNIPEFLVQYRVHGNNVTHTRKPVVRENLVAVYRELLGQLDIEPTPEEIEIHHLIREGRSIPDAPTFEAARRWLIKLKEGNTLKKTFPRREFAEVMLNRWTKVVWMSRGTSVLFFRWFFDLNILKEYLLTRVVREYA